METHVMSAIISLLLLIATTSTVSVRAAGAVKERCNPEDKKVLLSIKASFDNAYAFSSWFPDGDCCTEWYMVKCDRTTHRIISLNVGKDVNLTGSLPPAIGDLPFLQTLTFRKLPNLTGTIPSTVANLQYLYMATFDGNSLSGPVPSFFHRMPSLSGLDLSFNRFSGSIPPELALSPSLVSLVLGRNLLTGSIPESFGHFKNGWFHLDLSHNKLSGEIPRSLGNLKFSVIYLARNQLTGDAAFLFGKDKPLVSVDLSRNNLSFDFSAVEMSSGKKLVDLNHNRIYGGFPATGMESVWYLNVSYNRLCGAIPNVGELPTFDQTAYFHNKCLCGSPLPACNSSS